MSSAYLLDSSFVVDLLNELAAGTSGPALAWLRSNPRARLWISPITLAEVLEGARDAAAARAYLARYSWQGIHRGHAERVAQMQRRTANRLGENDAWQVAIAEGMQATILGRDRAFRRLGPGYCDYRVLQVP